MSRGRVLCRAPGCWHALARGSAAGSPSLAPRPVSVRRRCWEIGRGGAASRLRGCRWMRVTTTRRGFGGMSRRRWSGRGRGSVRRSWRCCAARSSRRRGRGGTGVIREWRAGPGGGGVVFVLDDYHLVEAPPVHESVAFLLARLPPGLRVVLSSRADPPLPLARLRARGQLAEFRAADL